MGNWFMKKTWSLKSRDRLSLSRLIPLFFLPNSTLLFLTIHPPSPISIQYFVLNSFSFRFPSHSHTLGISFSFSPILSPFLSPSSPFLASPYRLFIFLPSPPLQPIHSISPISIFFPPHFSLLISMDLHIPVLWLSLFILPLLLPFHFIFPPFFYPFSLSLHFHSL